MLGLGSGTHKLGSVFYESQEADTGFPKTGGVGYHTYGYFILGHFVAGHITQCTDKMSTIIH